MTRERFQSGMEKIRMSEEQREALLSLADEKKGKRRRMSGKKIAAVLAAGVLVLALGGVTVNAATDGALLETVKSFTWIGGGAYGPTSVFLAGKVSDTEELEKSDFPEGSLFTRVWPAGDNEYRTAEGEVFPMSRVLILLEDGEMPSEEEEDGGEGNLAVVLPEDYDLTEKVEEHLRNSGILTGEPQSER